MRLTLRKQIIYVFVILVGLSALIYVIFNGVGADILTPADVTIDQSKTYQTIAGWSGVPKYNEYMPDYLREQMMDELVNDLGLNIFRLTIDRREWEDPQNDNNDPLNTDWSKFNSTALDNLISQVVLPLKTKVAANGEKAETYFSPSFFKTGSSGPAPSWLSDNPGEYREWALAALNHLKNNHNLSPDYYTIANEPDNGTAFTKELTLQLTKEVGQAIKDQGWPTKMHLADNMSSADAVAYLNAALKDPDVWPYLGMLSYHLYGDESQRAALAKIAASKNLPLYQTENGVGDVNSIYDDLILAQANSSTQYVMFGWANQFAGDAGAYLGMKFNNNSFIRNRQYWNLRQIFHYVRPESVRIEAASNLPAVKSLAFIKDNKVTTVLFNNNGGAGRNITLAGLPAGQYGQSAAVNHATSTEYGLKTVGPNGLLTVNVPNNSIFTIYPYAGVNQNPRLTDWKASPDYLIKPTTATTLTATALDPEKSNLTYNWSVSGNPAGTNPALAAPNQATTLVSGLGQVGDYRFKVTVSDGQASTFKEVFLKVFETNQPPIADDLHNRQPVTVYAPTTSTTLKVAGLDQEGDKLSYQWSIKNQPVGAAASLASPTASTTSVTNLTKTGDYLFQIDLGDGQNSATAFHTVTVYPANPNAPQITSISANPTNLDPPTTTAALAAVTQDLDNDPLSHWWSVKAKPAGAEPTFSNPASLTTDVANLNVGGDYTFTLYVVDQTKSVSKDVRISVIAPSDTEAPTAPTNLTGAVNNTTLDLAWTAATDNIGVTNYDIFRNDQKVGSSNNLTYQDQDLATGTTYVYTVKALDAAGNVSPYSNIVTITIPDTTSPTAPSNLAGRIISETRIDLDWQASTDNVSVIKYDVYRNSEKLASTSTTNYSDLTIVPGQAYVYKVSALDAAGNQSLGSNEISLTIEQVDTTAPTAPTNLRALVIGGTVVLDWLESTDNLAIGGYEIYRDNQKIALSTLNYYQDSAVNQGSSYTYSVKAYDTGGNLSSFSNQQTVTIPDLIPPTAPSNLSATLNNNQIDLAWQASTDNVGVSSYQIYRNNLLLGQVNSAVLTYTDSKIEQGKTYQYLISAQDLAENQSASSNSAFVIVPDTTAPTAPTNLTGRIINNQINLDWQAATDNLAVTGYQVFRANALIATTSSPAWIDQTALAGSTHSYFVNAFDAANNKSEASNTVTITLPDFTPPTAPTNLIATINNNQIDLTWSASTDNGAVIEYLIYRALGGSLINESQIGQVSASSTAYPDSTVSSGQTYTYALKAKDSAGNLSGFSSAETITLAPPGDTTAPTAPSGLQAKIAGPKINLSWQASTDNLAVAGYKIYRNNLEIAVTINLNYQDKSLEPGSYLYKVRAFDAAGNLSEKSNQVSVEIADQEKPSSISNLSARVINDQVKLNWIAAADNVAVVGYQIYREKTLIASKISDLNYLDTSPVLGADNTYSIIASDAADNQSEENNQARVKIFVPDPEPLSAPSDLEAKVDYNSAIGGYEVDLSWQEDFIHQDAKNRLYVNGQKLALTDNNHFIDKKAKPGELRTYAIQTEDDNGNLSNPSSQITISLPDELRANQYKVESINKNSIKLSLNSNLPSILEIQSGKRTWWISIFDAIGNLIGLKPMTGHLKIKTAINDAAINHQINLTNLKPHSAYDVQITVINAKEPAEKVILAVKRFKTE